MKALDYLRQLQALLPVGIAWSRAPTARLTQLLHGFAEEFARIEARSGQLLCEADPRTTDELLTDWERVYGLPDVCVRASGIEQSLSERSAALVSLVQMQGGQSCAFFIEMAAALGYSITIAEWQPFTTESCTENGVIGEEAHFVWQVNCGKAAGFREFNTNDHSETPLAMWGRFALLECRLRRFKPAHTHLIFSYS